LLEPLVEQDARVQLHQGLSHEVLAIFPDAYFDWVYIDADHSYAGVTRDANAAASKVKPGGFLVFNDFAHMDPFLGAYGVHRAVVDFAVARSWHLPGLPTILWRSTMSRFGALKSQVRQNLAEAAIPLERFDAQSIVTS
jgi:hypothetical protein